MEAANPLWDIQLMGGLNARWTGPPNPVAFGFTRCRTQSVSALLGLLVCHSGAVSRYDAAALLWPEADGNIENSFCVTLSRLRKLLEPSGVANGSILIADALTVQLHPNAYQTDAREFPDALKAAQGAHAKDYARRVEAYRNAVSIYDPEKPFLWGNNLTWVEEERNRRFQKFCGALNTLIELLEEDGQTGAALEYVVIGIESEPLKAVFRRAAVRLYEKIGDSIEAHRQKKALAQINAGSLPAAVTKIRSKKKLQRVLLLPSRSVLSLEALPEPTAVTSVCPITLRLPMTDALCGRETEREQAGKLFDSERLTTLKGMGGIGKTHLAIEIARDIALVPERAVWYVPLADARNSDQALGFLHKGLNLPEEEDAGVIEQAIAFLSAHVAPRLVLDNAEHLLPELAGMVNTLLERVPRLSCLVTSREPLALPGEYVYPLFPFPLPPLDASLEEASVFPAVALFVQQARLALPGFALTPRNLISVLPLCHKLGGHPLALKLAATCGYADNLPDLLAHLEGHLMRLKERKRGAEARHRSLEAVLLISYNRLPTVLQTFFARLSVFRGGWTLKASESVGANPVAAWMLQQLFASSLIEMYMEGDIVRYGMLETVHQFSRERLAELPVESEAAHTLHADYYDCKLQEAEPYLTGANGIAWLDWIDREYANIEAALAWEIRNTSRPRILCRQAIHTYWHLRRPITAVREWLRGSLAPMAPASHPFMRAKVLVNLGGLSVSCGEYEQAEGYLLEGWAYFRDNGHQDDELGCLINLAYLALQKPDYPMALVYAQEGLARAEERNRLDEQALHWKGLAHARMHLRAYEGAQEAFANARALYVQLGEEERLFALDLEAGLVFHLSGDNARAITHWQQGLERARRTANAHSIGSHLLHIGRAQQELKEWKAAKNHYREALRMFQRLPQLAGIALVIAAAAELMLAEGRIETAGYYVGVAENIWRQAGRVNAPYRQEIFAALWENPMFQSKREQGSIRAVAAELIDLDTMPFSF